MAMSEQEKQQVLNMLNQMDDQKRKGVIASLESFGRWLQNSLSQIYYKIKNSLQSLWRSLKTAFS